MATFAPTAAFDPAQHRPVPRRYAWTVFGILFALMVVDYVDRQVVVSMFPHLKAEWGLSDRQLGGLVSIVSITVALGTVPLSLLADRWSRVKSIFLMALVWSAATIGCAFAGSYAQLLGARSVVGLGEAAYGSAGAALLASLFPRADAQHRARRFPGGRPDRLGAWRHAGRRHRRALGLAGGIRRGRHPGPDSGAGLPAARARLQDGRAARHAGGGRPATDHAQVRRRARCFGRAPRSSPASARACSWSMVSTTYAWMPSYFNRFYGLAPDQAGLKTGVVVLDGRARRRALEHRRRPAEPACPPRPALRSRCGGGPDRGVHVGVAFAASAGPATRSSALIVAGATVMTGSIGPVCAVVVDVVHPGLRATAAAVLSLAQNLFGLAAGPLLTGVLSDAYGLPFALSVMPVFCLLAAVTFAIAARTYEADLKQVEGVEPAPDHELKTQAA